MRSAYLYDAVRSPRGKGRWDGSLHEITPVQLGAQILAALQARNGFANTDIEDVVFGCVTPLGEQGGNIARACVLMAGYAETTPGMQLNRFCASGLEAVNITAAKVIAGDIDLGVGGGVEMMSRIPMGADSGAMLIDPRSSFDAYIVPQGISADIIATKYGISRSDADAYSIASHQRAAHSWERGHFEKSIVAVKDLIQEPVLAYDETIRPGANMDSLAALKPAFQALGEVMPGYDKVALQKYPELAGIDHVHTAGNSSGIADGAAGVLIGSREMGKKLGLKPRAKIKAMASIGSEPTIMLTGPEFVTKKILKRNGMSASDIDVWELNEAFASVVLRYMQAMAIDHERINVNGGAIAMGHPMGATGAMILGTALDTLERLDHTTALVSLCIGAGMGTATIIERV